jgi:hypothetical protein
MACPELNIFNIFHKFQFIFNLAAVASAAPILYSVSSALKLTYLVFGQGASADNRATWLAAHATCANVANGTLANLTDTSANIVGGLLGFYQILSGVSSGWGNRR